MKLSKKKFLKGFVAATLLLAVVRLVFPSVARPLARKSVASVDTTVVDSLDTTAVEKMKPSVFFDAKGQVVKHRIFSVPHFGNTFPDQNDVQLLAANRFGVSGVCGQQPLFLCRQVEQQHPLSCAPSLGVTPRYRKSLF